MLLDHLRYVKGDISIKEVSDATMIKSSVGVGGECVSGKQG